MKTPMKSLENAPLDVPSRRLGPPTRLRTCCLQLLVQLLDGLLQGRLARVQKLIRRLDVLRNQSLSGAVSGFQSLS